MRDETYKDKLISMGLKIAYYRKKAGLTQEALADRVGISQTALSHIESPTFATSFKLETLFKICDALGVAPEEIIYDSESFVH